MKKITRTLIFLLIFTFSHSIFSQVTLSQNDLVVLQYNSDGGDDEIALLALANITAGDNFFVSDGSWQSGTSSFQSTTERGIKLTVGVSGITAGTIIRFDNPTGTQLVLEDTSLGTLEYLELGGLTETGSSRELTLSTSGDQLLIFQTSDGVVTSTPTFIYGFNTNISSSETNGWSTLVTINSSESNLPTGLTSLDGTQSNKTTASAFGLAGLLGSESDNYQYTGATTAASRDDWLTRVHTLTNWTANDASGFTNDDIATGGDVTVTGGCAAPTAQATSAVFGSETSSTLTLTSFTAPAGGATGYAIYINDTNTFTAPTDGDEPTDDLTWNGAGQQPVYFGTSASPGITVSDLDPGTTYYFQIYAYNDCSGTETYETTGLNANDTTALGVLTITGLTGDDKVYDDNNSATATGTAALNGVAAGANDVSLSGSPTFSFASANVGTGITITTSGYTLSGTDSGKYTLTQPTLSADITAKELTISGLTGGDKTYDDNTSASASGTATLVGVESGDDVSLGGSPTFTFASANVGTGITINTLGYTISGTDSGNYTLTQPTLSGDITAKELTISGLTGGDKVYDDNDSASASGTATLVGVESGDDVSLGGSPVFTFASANVGTGITITTTGYTISGTDSGNYTLTQPTLSGDITAKGLTISGLTGGDKVYDDSDSASASGTATLVGVESGDDVSLGGSPVFTFASANVGTGITITTTGYTISGTDSGNYTLTQPTLSGDITAKGLTISGLTGGDKVYDDSDSASASGTATLVGVESGDDVSLGGSPVFTFASANVGTGITITTTGYTISGTDSGNYTLTQPTLSGDITAKELTISGLTGGDKTYDDNTSASASGTATLVGVESGDDVSLGGSPTFTFASANVGTGITINTLGYTISGTDSGNYTLTQPTLSGDITAKELTISGLTGGDKVYDDNDSASATGTATLVGVETGDDVSLGGSPVFTFASANVGTGITITTTGYTISGTDSGNYTLTQPTLSGDITAKELTITGLTGDDKTYDDNTSASATGTATLVGVESGDDVSLGGSPVFTFASANVGTGITINTLGYTISGTDSGNYTLTQPTLSGDITAKELTITGLTGDDKVYDDSLAASATGTATLVGVESGDDVSLGGSPVFTFASANVGTGITITTTGYTISGTDSGNYTLTQPTLSADITAKELTITGLTGDNKVYDDSLAASATGTATLVGVETGDDVSLGGSPVFTFASANVGTGITITTTGYTISGTDSGNYTLTQPTLSGDITAKELTITGLTGDNKLYDGTTAASASGTATLVGVETGDDVSLGGSPVFTFASANVGTGITINTIGYTISGTDSGNYTLTQPTLSADITGITLTITGLTGDNKVYDDGLTATASGTATLNGVLGGDDVSLAGSPVFTFASANVGTGITITTTGYTLSGADAGKYSLTQPTLSADITAKELTISGLTGDNKAYDGTTAATASGTATLVGVESGDDVSLGGSPVFAFASANVGTGITVNTSGYTISGTDSGNYTLTQPTLSADITGAELTIVGLTGDDKVYDGTMSATASGTATLSGIIGADDVILGGSPVFAFASANVGTGITMNTSGYTISGTDSGNYTLTQPTLSADITAKELTITGLTGDDKVYDDTIAASASGTATLVGVETGDDVSLGGSPVFTFASANVGTGITITTTGYTISGTDSGNYTLTQPTLSADITAKELTITGLTGDNKSYDGTTAATASGTATLVGVETGDDVSLGGSPVFAFASANVGTGITITTTGYTISGTDSGNYTLTQPTLSAAITAKELTITGLTGDNKSYDGTTAATASGTATLVGVETGDDVSLGGSPVFAFASANVGTGITVNTSGYTISGTDSGNYTLTQPTLSADITGAELTIVGLTGDDKVYDGTTAATASGTATLSGIIGADDVSIGGSPVFVFASANVGTGVVINTSGYTISGTDSGNYTLTQPILSGDITAAELTIVGLTGDDKVYDGTTAATATGTATLSGIIGADDVILGGSPVFTFASANVGTGITMNTSGYTISGTDSGNYTLTQPTLSADITAAELTIVGLTGDNKTYDGTTAATASGTATLSGIIGADDVILGGSPVFTFASANVGTGITVFTSGYTISGTDSGNYTLTQPTLSADITAAELTIVGLTGDNKVYDGTTAATATGTATLSGIIGADDVIVGGSPVFAFASANVGTGITMFTSGYTISGTNSGNYTLTQPTLSADITAAELTIVGLTGDNKTYDGTTAATASGTATLSGIIGADDVILGGSPVFTFASANVGTGITVFTSGYTISGTDSGNYTLTQPTLSADITAAELTIVGLTGDNKTYDGTTAATATGTATLSGIIGADDVILGGSPVFTFASANVGTGITINTSGYTTSGTDSGNYLLTQPTLSADITAAELTIVGLTGDNKVYDGTTVATATGTATLSGIIGADDVILGGSPVFTFASANVGTGITISTLGYTISGTDSGNYSLTQPTLSADITAAELTIVGLTGDDKVYDGTTAATATGTATLSGIIGADDVILGGSPVFTFASANVGTGIVINATGYTISGTNSANYSLTQPILSGDITAAELTIVGLTGDNKVYDGTTAATATGTATLSGIFGADDVILGGAPVFTFASANVGTGITINTSGYTISGTDSGNYTLTQPTLSADITAAELTIVGLTGDNKVYDGTTAATASGTATLSGIIGADDVILGGSPFFTFASANVGTGITVFTSGYTTSGTDSGNYTLTQPTLSADITAAELTIVGLTGDNKVYDGTTAATASGTATLSGIIGADDVILGGSPVFVFASANVGTGITINTSGYTISGTNSANYTLTQPTLSADITAAELTVVGLTGDDKVYDGTTAATASGTATLSGIIGADDVILGGSPVFTFASADPGTAIAINTVGYTISGTDSGNYLLTQPTLSADIFGPEISFNSVASGELENIGSANITVDLSVSVPITVTVDYAVTGGTATSADFTLANGTLTFDPNTSSNDIVIDIIDELMVEPNETVEITLSNPSALASLGTNLVHTFTITNDDSASVTIEDVSGNEDDGDVTFTATLDNPVQGGFTVDVNTLDATATVADSDYTPVTGEILTFAGTAGETQTFIVTPTADNKVEEDETVTIGMTTVDNTPSFNDIIITDTASLTILNEDTTEVTIDLDAVDVDEDAGFALLTATLSNPVQGDFFINITTSDGTAMAPGDYTASNNDPNIDFGGFAGEQQTIFVPIIDDSQGELSETFTVTLTSVSGTTLGAFITTTDSAVVTIIDNDAPVVSGVDVPADGLYGIGNTLDFTVTFTDFVTTTGTPVIPITIGSTTVNAELSAPVANSLTAVFSYTILEGQEDVDGIAVGTDIDLNGGTIIGTNSTIDAILTLNGVASTANVNVDGIRPIPFVDSTEPDPTNQAFTVTIDFDEDVTGFADASILVVNGNASGVVEVTPSSYTALITPTTDGLVTVSVPTDGAFDAAGNGNAVSNDFTILYDATNPEATISTTAPDPVNTPFTVDILWTENVFGFDMSDLVVTNGTPSAFTEVTPSTEFSVLITPDGSGPVFVDIPAAVTEDLATNPNNAATFEIEYDNIPPLPPNITHISEYSCSGDVTQTGDNTLEISGTAERESTVEVFIDGISIGTTLTDADTGFFTFDYTGTVLADGTYTFTAQATDIAMNTGAISAGFTITVNTVDSDGDGNPDFCDDDDNGNGAVDTEEDCDGDGIVDSQDTDNSSCSTPITETKTYGFSPNGDGINDGWVIENIEAFPNNTVSLFNRSGKLVFRESGYKNTFEGISNQLNGNSLGNRLPVGPYLFVIDLGDGSAPTRGWLYVNY